MVALNHRVSRRTRDHAGRLAAWGARGGLAIADQALYAGAHFLLNILLARWLVPADYGAFALAYSAFLLIAALYAAVVLEPMAVFGPGRYSAHRQGYLGILLRAHLPLTLPAVASLLCGAVIAGALGAPMVRECRSRPFATPNRFPLRRRMVGG